MIRASSGGETKLRRSSSTVWAEALAQNTAAMIELIKNFLSVTV
jgi:hypothetical protein